MKEAMQDVVREKLESVRAELEGRTHLIGFLRVPGW